MARRNWQAPPGLPTALAAGCEREFLKRIDETPPRTRLSECAMSSPTSADRAGANARAAAGAVTGLAMSPLIRSALWGPTAFSFTGGCAVVAVLTLLIVLSFCVVWFRIQSR